MKIIYVISIDGYIKYEGNKSGACIYEISEKRWKELKQPHGNKEYIPCSSSIISEIEKGGKSYA